MKYGQHQGQAKTKKQRICELDFYERPSKYIWQVCHRQSHLYALTA